MSDIDQQTLDNIQEYGCSVMHIAGEDDLPPFSYSVGVQQTSGAPEMVVIGLKPELAHAIVNQYNTRVRAGETFTPGQRYAGYLGGFDVAFVPVDKGHYEEYFGVALWLYQGPNFEVLQLVYPSTQGVWPWDAQASEGFRHWQPLLDSAPESEGNT